MRNKHEARNLKRYIAALGPFSRTLLTEEFRTSDFGFVSGFELRISDFMTDDLPWETGQ